MVDTDRNKIEEILNRSVAEVLPSREALVERLREGVRLRFYIGADATGPQLHLGHATNFLLLEKIRRLGHEVIILFGDFTALIGDPTDKDATRKVLSEEEIRENIATWKQQVAKVIRFDGENPAIIKRNSEWLSGLSFRDVIRLSSHFTVQHMLERDMFEKRMREGKPVHLHEFLYPLTQGYDSVAMDVDVEVGGTDQTFNMLAGRILQRKLNGREKFVISTTLLENPKTGSKLMSKSEGNYIALDDAPADMYGKVMALPDETIPQMFADCTEVPLEEIVKIEKELAKGANPRDAKMQLAREIVSLYHGEENARDAEKQFVEVFSKGGVPDDVQTVRAEKGAELADILLANKIVSSKSEWRRLVGERAVADAHTGEPVSDPYAAAAKSMTVRVGKKRFISIEI